MENPTIKRRGSWKPEEDKRCKQAVYKILKELKFLTMFKVKGELPSKFPWTKVALTVKTRNRKQCRTRFNNLNPFLTKSAWTLVEDAKIKEMQPLFPNSWKKISKYLVGRGPNEVKIRWKTINKKRISIPVEIKERNQITTQDIYDILDILKEETIKSNKTINKNKNETNH